MKVLRHQGELAAARALLEECLPLFRAAGDTWQVAEALTELGSLAQERGDAEQVATLASESLRLTREWGLRWYLPESLGLLAGVASVRGDPARAARLFGAEEALREATGQALQPSERVVRDRHLATAHAGLGEAAFTAAWAAGRKLSPEQATEEALEIATPTAAPPLPGGRSTDPLTAREREVAALVARGLTNRQIAGALVISERTADNHVGHILDKLGLTSRAQVAAWAVSHGLAGAAP
jgi:non-specific serine/threonine protein kinase